jgi:hypothetical protein
MRSRTLALLERLERRALDQLAIQIGEADRQLDEERSELGAVRRCRPAEMAAGWAIPGGARLIAGYWRGSLDRERRALSGIARLDAERGRLADAVLDRLAEARRYELLQQAEDQRELAGAERSERLEIEDAVLARRAAAGREPGR